MPCQERSRAVHRLDLVPRQRLARPIVARERGEHLGQPREVLHELARQLDRVPRDAVHAGERRIVDFGQQMVQRVAELVEQRHDLAMREQRRGLAERRIEVADEIARPARGACR